MLGGFLTTYLSWRWIFWVNFPFGVIGSGVAVHWLLHGEVGTQRLAVEAFCELLAQLVGQGAVEAGRSGVLGCVGGGGCDGHL